MATLATRGARPSEPRLFGRPVLLRRTRRNVVELVGWVWLLIEVAGWVRSRLEKPTRKRP
jgi:hypothetical protein